jgi:hypothetical protein
MVVGRERHNSPRPHQKHNHRARQLPEMGINSGRLCRLGNLGHTRKTTVHPFHLAQMGYFNNRSVSAKITGFAEDSQINILVTRSRLAEAVIQHEPRAVPLPVVPVRRAAVVPD